MTKIRHGTASVPLTAATVLDDKATDFLIGLASRNWFWQLPLDLVAQFDAEDALN